MIGKNLYSYLSGRACFMLYIFSCTILFGFQCIFFREVVMVVRKYPAVLLLLVCCIVSACSGTTNFTHVEVPGYTGDNSRTSLDWDGAYKGMLPSADGKGIKTVIILRKDGTYLKESRHYGEQRGVVRKEGLFTWSDNGSSIRFSGDDADAESYLVGEKQLFLLGSEGFRMTSDGGGTYVLRQISGRAVADVPLESTMWRLVELDGFAVIRNVADATGAYLVFDESEGLVNGSTGCNRFFGSYRVDASAGITFGSIGATMMACPAEIMEQERLFFFVLDTATGYEISGETLVLSGPGQENLARFEAEMP